MRRSCRRRPASRRRTASRSGVQSLWTWPWPAIYSTAFTREGEWGLETPRRVLIGTRAAPDGLQRRGREQAKGPYGSTNALPVAAVAEQAKVPMIEGNAPAKAIYSKGYHYAFGAMAPTDKYMQGVLDMAASMNPKPATVAVLSADDAFSAEVAKAAVDYAGMKGLQVVYNQQYPNGSTNVAPLLTAAKQKNPDIVINSGHTVEAIAISKAARDIRLDAKIFAYTIGPTTPDFLQALGKSADYVVTGSHWSPDVKYKPAMYLSVGDYASAYEQRYGTKDPPSYIVAQSTAACLALQRAIENAGSLDREKVRSALAALDLITFYGRAKFDEHGLNVYKP